MTDKSVSTYRITDKDCLPREYIKSKEFVDISSYDENIVLLKGKYVRRNICPICGDFATGKLCLKCRKDKRAERIPSREYLIGDLITNKPLVKLAKIYGISDTAYRKWLAKRGLPTRSKDIKLFIVSLK